MLNKNVLIPVCILLILVICSACSIPDRKDSALTDEKSSEELSGEALVMPDVTGMPRYEAVSVLSDLKENLEIKIYQRYVPDAVPGRVVSSSPSAGKDISQTTTVSLFIQINENGENDDSLQLVRYVYVNNHRGSAKSITTGLDHNTYFWVLPHDAIRPLSRNDGIQASPETLEQILQSAMEHNLLESEWVRQRSTHLPRRFWKYSEEESSETDWLSGDYWCITMELRSQSTLRSIHVYAKITDVVPEEVESFRAEVENILNPLHEEFLTAYRQVTNQPKESISGDILLAKTQAMSLAEEHWYAFYGIDPLEKVCRLNVSGLVFCEGEPYYEIRGYAPDGTTRMEPIYIHAYSGEPVNLDMQKTSPPKFSEWDAIKMIQEYVETTTTEKLNCYVRRLVNDENKNIYYLVGVGPPSGDLAPMSVAEYRVNVLTGEFYLYRWIESYG